MAAIGASSDRPCGGTGEAGSTPSRATEKKGVADLFFGRAALRRAREGRARQPPRSPLYPRPLRSALPRSLHRAGPGRGRGRWMQRSRSSRSGFQHSPGGRSEPCGPTEPPPGSPTLIGKTPSGSKRPFRTRFEWCECPGDGCAAPDVASTPTVCSSRKVARQALGQGSWTLSAQRRRSGRFGRR
jgi:hypothetical protein